MTEPKRPIRLSRGQKIVRNLLLAVLAGFLVWVNTGAPLPPELAFRRVQRENFLTPYAQFLGVCEADDFRWGVGLTDRWLVFGELDSHQLALWPLEGDGPMVIPAPDRYSRGIEELGFVAVNAPEGTATARLTATVSCWYTHTGTFSHSTTTYWATQDQDWEGLTPLTGSGPTPPRGSPWRTASLCSACRRSRMRTLWRNTCGRSGRLGHLSGRLLRPKSGRPGRRLRPDGGVLRRPGTRAGPGGAHRRRRRVECGRALQKGFPLQGGSCRASRRD